MQQEGRKLRDIVCCSPECAFKTNTIRDVARRMAKAKLCAIPVVEGTQLVGVLCNCQITDRVVAQGLDAASTTVEELMDADPVRISDDRDVETAMLVMRTRNASILAVQDCFGRFIGLLTGAELCRTHFSSTEITP